MRIYRLVTGNVINSGNIAGHTALSLTADNIKNLGGRIDGNQIALTARNNIDIIGGTVTANQQLLINAGGNLNVTSTTRSATNTVGANSFERTTIDRLAGLYVSEPNGILLASAGQDINFKAANLINSGTDGQTLLIANNINLSTVTTSPDIFT